MIELVPTSEHGYREYQSPCLYVLVQGEYSFQLQELSNKIMTKQLLFINTDISAQGRTDLVNYVMAWIENNPL